MLDSLIDPDDDPETELWEHCESVASQYIIEYIENLYDDDQDLEDILMMVFERRGIQLPLRVEEITDYCYYEYDEQDLVFQIESDCPNVYNNFMDYVMSRVTSYYDDYDYDD